MGEKKPCPPCIAIQRACEETKDPLLCEIARMIEEKAPIEAVERKLASLPKDSLLKFAESLQKVVESQKFWEIIGGQKKEGRMEEKKALG
jgi:hypothetical protein